MSTFAAGEPAGGAALSEILVATLGATLLTSLLIGLGLAHRAGRTELLARPAAALGRRAGMPGWTILPALLAAVSLQVALLGMYWDISLHIDVGRDAGPLANPAHYLILFGLFGVFSAGFLAMVLPREQDGPPSPTAIRITRDWHAPLGGVLVAACGAFSLIGFPLDDVWHRLFGQDVTLWGPTHLMLIGGAAMTLIGLAVLQVEGRRSRTPEMRAARPTGLRRLEGTLRLASVCGGLLIGMSTFQAEFDFGVPQFRLLFQPLLIALAAAFTLVVARMWGGRGTALGAVVFFLILRGLIALIVGPVLGETTPHLPLYLAEALVVELLAWRKTTIERPYAFGAAAGALIGTVGLAAEWGWSHLWMPLPWNTALLPEALLLTPLIGVAAGLLGAFTATALRGERSVWGGGGRLAVPAAALAVVAIVGYGLSTAPLEGVRAQVALTPAGPGEATARVQVTPAGAAEDAEWLTVTAWQGGGLVVDRLRRTGPGRYETTRPIPAAGDWKAMVRLHRGRALMASPIYMPADPAIPAEGVPARAAVERPFQADKRVLQREAKPGVPGALTTVGYLTVLAIALGLLAALGWGLARLAARAPDRPGDAPPPSAPRAPDPARALEGAPA